MGLVIDWDELKRLYDGYDLPPTLASRAWRESIPLYHGETQVGYATSGAWSPMVKEALAIATIESAHAGVGTQLAMEWTVEHRRHRVSARVSSRPFFDPARKKGRA
jgi:aminomethyltransferase